MNIYFAGSIRGGRNDRELYLELIKHLQKYGSVLTEHIGDPNLSLKGEDGIKDCEIHNRDMMWVDLSDRIVSDVTQTSLGVGYEIGRVVERNLWVPKDKIKPILALYKGQSDRRLSAMIAGSNGVMNIMYNSLDEARNSIDKFMSIPFEKFYVKV